MFCQNCGKEIGDSDKFCEYCGFQLNNISNNNKNLDSKDYCPNCNKKIGKNDTFCEHCGFKLNNISDLSKTCNVSQNETTFWKTLTINIVGIALFALACVGIYNSDWYINQTMGIREIEPISLGKNTKWSYINKYENGRLKIQISLHNVDKKMAEILDNYLSEKDYLIKLQFLDETEYKLAELEMPIGDFVFNSSIYQAQGILSIDKNSVRKINKIQPVYREALDMKYSDYIRNIQRTMRNIFGYGGYYY